jgi:hypothetical protein
MGTIPHRALPRPEQRPTIDMDITNFEWSAPTCYQRDDGKWAAEPVPGIVFVAIDRRHLERTFDETGAAIRRTRRGGVA